MRWRSTSASRQTRPPNSGQYRGAGPVNTGPMRQLTLGAGDHGAGSCAPNRYHAVPSQRTIDMGNVLGNSKSPTALRLCLRTDLPWKFESSPGTSFLIFQFIISLYKCHFEYRKTRTSVWHYRGSGYRARTQTLCATPLISGLIWPDLSSGTTHLPRIFFTIMI